MLNIKILSLILFCSLSSCSLIDTRGISINTCPGERGQVLEADDSLWVNFSEPVIKREAEGLFSINSPDGPVPGDYFWEENRLIFSPLQSLTPGTRYSISFRGIIHGNSGRSSEADLSIPFFFRSSGEGPRCVEFTPDRGSCISMTVPLELYFSCSMDTVSFYKGFSISPSRGFYIEWTDNNCKAVIAPRKGWVPRETYTWDISRLCRNSPGIPLESPVSGIFRVQGDNDSPSVLSILPAVPSGDAFLAVSDSLDDICCSDALLISFSEAVDTDSLEKAFSLTPSTEGVILPAGLESAVFVPENKFIPDTSYTVSVSIKLKDLYGNPSASFYTECFTTPDENIKIAKIRSIGREIREYTEIDYNNLDSYNLTFFGPDLNHTFEYYFSRKVPVSSREKVLQKVVCRSIFPETLSMPRLENAGWDSGGTILHLGFTDFQKSRDDIKGNYYLLSVTGEAVNLFFRAETE